MNGLLSHLIARFCSRLRTVPFVQVALLAWLSAAGFASAQEPPRVLFQDGFGAALVGGQPDVPPWTSRSIAESGHALTIRTDDDGIFSAAPENRFLEYRDSRTDASLILSAGNTLSTEVATFSFLFHEPSDPAYPGQLTIQFFAGNGSPTLANRVQVFHFREGAIRGLFDIPYGLNQTRRIDLVLNNSAVPVTYDDGRRTVASGKADVWIDGELVFQDFSNERQAGTGPIRGFDIRSFTSQSQRAYLDNITVFEGAVAGAPFFPSPDQASFPLILQKNREVAELFGYAPEFSLNAISFDSFNRPYLRSRTADIDETRHVETFRDGAWVERSFISAIEELYPDFDYIYRGAGWLGARIVFDRLDRMYTAVKIRRTNGAYANVLLFSTDYGQTFSAVDLRTSGDVALEHVAGHNRLDGPPFVLIQHRRVADHESEWADYHEMRVVQPRLVGDTLEVPPHVHVTDSLISIGQHSGGSSFAATRDGKTHFAWIEIADSPVPDPGSPTYAATYDHATGTVGPKRLVAFAPPANNSHNRPGLVLDSEGYIHVVTGSHHGENFFYSRSLQPGRTDAGWTAPTPVWDKGWRNSNGNGPERGGQTYVSLVCDADDTLHLAFRQWRYADEYFNDAAYYAALSYQRKPKGGDWTEPVPLIIPERGIYAIYYQKLSLDRRGRLFLSASYFDNTLGETPELGRYLRRMLLFSPDGGDTWRFAETGALDSRWFFTRYERWQRGTFTPEQLANPDIAGPAAQPAGDGVPNLLKAALDLDPWQSGREALPSPFLDELGRLTLQFELSADWLDHVSVETSTDLITWTTETVERDAEPVGDNRYRVHSRLPPEASAGQRIFLRLRVDSGE